MDRELSIDFKKKQYKKLILQSTLGLAIVCLGYAAFRGFIKPSIDKNAIIISHVQLSSLESSVNATGVVVPEYEIILTSPLNARIEAVIHNAGDTVLEGQSILQLNREAIVNEYDNLRDEQLVNKNKAAQIELNLEKTLNDLQTQYAIKELTIKSLEAKLLQEQSLLSIGGSAEENVKQAQLNLFIASHELHQLEKLINNQKAAKKVELLSLGYEMKIKEKNIRTLNEKLKRAMIQAPRNSVVTSVKDLIGSAVSEGEEVARVADLSSFKVEGQISDAYAASLKVGGPVIVRINNDDIRGVVASIQPNIVNGIIKFMISLKHKNHHALRSNAKVDVFVITSFKENALLVKNGQAFNGSSHQKIFIVNNNKAIAKVVPIGESNIDMVEIKTGVKAGDAIIISDMTAYDHLSEIIIEDQP